MVGVAGARKVLRRVDDWSGLAVVGVDSKGVGALATLPLELEGHTLGDSEDGSALWTKGKGNGEKGAGGAGRRTAMMLVVGVVMLKASWARAAPAAARRARAV